MNKNVCEKVNRILSPVCAFVFTALYFCAVYLACIYGSNFLIAEKLGGKYIAFMLVSVVLLLGEYIYFGHNDKPKKVLCSFLLHNLFGLIFFFVCGGIYSATDMQKQCILSTGDVLKNVFMSKWISYVCITLVGAVACYLFGTDKKTNGKVKKQKRGK